MVVVPPCTNFGSWSNYNRIHHRQTWIKSRRVGELLAQLTSDVCWFQLANHRHFVGGNPLPFKLWEVDAFRKFTTAAAICFLVRCDQRILGLVDSVVVSTLTPTNFLASHALLVKRLNVLYKGSHEHQRLEDQVNTISRWYFAQAWPYKLGETLF